ncbi:hypothetical protein NDU88_001851 [Pleurodeles waltl]|uniref:Uncharacterized protein n=1 Tax=Pleurodeles waltl TaxID=8319 RepID=A0AAV7LAY9_PLEWA|nr:hypothetical protein NDU88_001851 [Pleurodeles waltl]
MATVRLHWKGEDETIKVGVIPNLGEDLILGTDYVDFTSLLNEAGDELVHNAWWEEVPFGVGEEESRKPQVKLSRKQKREQRRMYQLARDPRSTDSKDPPAIIYTITGDSRQCQHEDLTLKHAWHQALNPDDHVGPGRGTTGSREEEKPAPQRRGAHDQEEEASLESGQLTEGEKKTRRKQVDERTPR